MEITTKGHNNTLTKGFFVEINLNRQQDLAYLSIEGELTINSSVELNTMFENLIKSGSNKVIVDFEKVDYIDSSGLSVLIAIKVRLKESNGDLVFINIAESVYRIFELTRLLDFFTILETKEIAEMHFKNITS